MGLLHVHTSSNPTRFAHQLLLLPSEVPGAPSLVPKSSSAMSCVLREGETLFIPPGWRIQGRPSCLDKSQSWERLGWIVSAIWRFQPKLAFDRANTRADAEWFTGETTIVNDTV